MSFAAAVAKLDAQADIRLGDPLFYHLGGLISAEPVNGFITDPAGLSAADVDVALDQIGQRVRLEINRAIVERPSKSDRIESDHRLTVGFIWAPNNWLPFRGGRYWIMDLKKVGPK